MEQGLAFTNQLFAQIGLPHMTFQCDAAGGAFEYTENGFPFVQELILTGIVGHAGGPDLEKYAHAGISGASH